MSEQANGLIATIRRYLLNVLRISVLSTSLLGATVAMAGSLISTNSPGPTMHSLDEIYHKLNAISELGGITLDRNITLVPKVLNFGVIPLGTTSTLAVAITSVGDFPMTITNIQYSSSAFTGSSTNYRIRVDAGYLSLNVSFLPSSTGAYSGTVTIEGNATTGSNVILCAGSCVDTPRFVDNGDGTVTDTATGLMWSKNANHGTMSRINAITYCNDLNYAGYSDWRLPSIRSYWPDQYPSTPEIDTLGRPGGVVAATPYTKPSDPFTDIQTGYFWAFNTDVNGYLIYSVTGGSQSSTSNSNTLYRVWPVRGGQ